MRILHCIPSLAGGGAERQLLYLVEGLVKDGVETHVAFHTSGRHERSIEKAGATLHRLQLKSNHPPALIAQLVRLVRELVPDLVQTWLLQMDVAGGIAALLTGTPFIVSERASAPCYGKSLKAFARRTVGRWANLIVANSRAGSEYWAALRDSDSVKIVRNGIPAELFDRATSPMSLQPMSDSTAEVILFAGRFSAEKNVHILLEALPGVFRQRPNAVAVLFGEGPLKQSLTGIAGRGVLAGRVCIGSYTARLDSWMRRANLLLSISTFEGCPNSVCEAAALGCPLLLSDIPAHRELMSEDSATFACVNSPFDTQRAILEILENPDVAMRKADRARQAISSLSLHTLTRDYLNLYVQVMSQGECKMIGSVRNPGG